MRYWVRDDPPLDEGADQLKETWVLPEVAMRDWGAVEVVAVEFATPTTIDALDVLLNVSYAMAVIV